MTHDDTTQLHIRLATPVARALSSLAQHRGQSRTEVIASILTTALRGYYNEDLDDLITVCSACHSTLHGKTK